MAAAAVLALFAAAPADAQLLEAPDAAELAQTLAEAQEEQDVCYGWEVTGSVLDAGSSVAGPGASAPARACAQWVVLSADVTYTCDSCEGEDYANVSVDSSFPAGPTAEDLGALGYNGQDLVSDTDDEALFNMVAALPLLVADRGLAPPVPSETPTAVPATDRATDTPGSDIWRDRWFVLLLCGFLLVAGPAYFLYKRGQFNAEAARRAEREERRQALARLRDQPTTAED